MYDVGGLISFLILRYWIRLMFLCLIVVEAR